MSVAPVDDGVDFGHDALEATSSAEAELAPDPLKKPASSLPSSSACPAVPDVPMDSSLPTSLQGGLALFSSQAQTSSILYP